MTVLKHRVYLLSIPIISHSDRWALNVHGKGEGRSWEQGGNNQQTRMSTVKTFQNVKRDKPGMLRRMETYSIPKSKQTNKKINFPTRIKIRSKSFQIPIQQTLLHLFSTTRKIYSSVRWIATEREIKINNAFTLKIICLNSCIKFEKTFNLDIPPDSVISPKKKL